MVSARGPERDPFTSLHRTPSWTEAAGTGGEVQQRRKAHLLLVPSGKRDVHLVAVDLHALLLRLHAFGAFLADIVVETVRVNQVGSEGRLTFLLRR